LWDNAVPSLLWDKPTGKQYSQSFPVSYLQLIRGNSPLANRTNALSLSHQVAEV